MGRVGRPYLNALGLDQGWGAFAPDPRQTSLDLLARITYEDGSKSVWHYPQSNPVYGEYWDYRWRKWLEWMVAISREDLRQPLVAWLARREAAHGRRPLRVVLVARWLDIPLPHFAARARQPATSTWREKQFYSVWVTPALLGQVTVG